MKIRSVEFAGSVAEAGQPPPGDLPQIAFSGRSNVGKSSLINTLLRRTRKKIAHVSGQPGKTRTLNFYRVNDRFFLVDLPGFGYARVPVPMREAWTRLVERYLAGPPGPRGVVHLVDARHEPSRLDRRMIELLGELGLPTLVVLTKIDKLGATARDRQIGSITRALGLDEEQVLPFSSRTGEGREELLDAIESLLPDDEGNDEGDREGAGT